MLATYIPKQIELLYIALVAIYRAEIDPMDNFKCPGQGPSELRFNLNQI